MKRISLATWSVIVLVVLFAIGAFIMSFDAVQNEAVRLGINPRLAWLLPFMYDGFIVLFGIGSIWAKHNNNRGYKYANVFIWVATILTVILNVTHAPQLDALHFMVFATPPLALAISFHFLVIMLEVTAEKLQAESKEDEELTSLLQDYDKRGEAIATLEQQLATVTAELATERQDTATIIQEQTAVLQASEKRLQNRITELQAKLDKAQAVEKILQDTGKGTMDTILVMAERYSGTQAEFAAAYNGYTAPVVSKLKKSLNGGVERPFDYLIENAMEAK